MNEKELEVAKKLKGERKNISDFFENNQDNKYVQFLIEKVVSEDFSLKESIEYGLSQISESKQEKMLLSSYFFLLSELEGINKEIRDFVLDVSVWCEGADEYSQYFNSFEPLLIYKKIESLLC